MPNQELLNYVQKQLEQGGSKEKITGDLLSNGWNNEDISGVFLYIENQSAQTQVTTDKTTKNIDPTISGVNYGKKMTTTLIVGVALLVIVISTSVGAYMGAIGKYPFINELIGKDENNQLVEQEARTKESADYPIDQKLTEKITEQEGETQLIKQDVVTEETTEPSTNQSNNISSLLEPEPYVDSAGDFKIYYPKDWLPDGAYPGVIIVFLNIEFDQGDGAPFSANINVLSKSSEGLDLNQYIEFNKELMALFLTNYELVEDRKIIIPSGQKAHILGSTFTHGVSELRNLQLGIIDNGKAYFITGTALESEWDKYKDVIEESLLTFELQ